MYFCDGKATFSSAILQSLVSHDTSEIILICRFGVQVTFLTIINVKNCSVKEQNVTVMPAYSLQGPSRQIHTVLKTHTMCSVAGSELMV